MSSVVSDFVHNIGQDLTSFLADEFGDTDGLTLTQTRILDCVERSPGRTQTVICMLARVDRSTLAEVCDRLAHRKLIVRKRDKSDKRAWNVTITAKGSAELAYAMAARSRAEAALVAKYPGLKKFVEELAKKTRSPKAAAPSSPEQSPRLVAAE